jgi:hypothetical protein
MECPGHARMKPMVARGCMKGWALVNQIQSKVAVVVKPASEGMRFQKIEGEKCRFIRKARRLHIVTVMNG